MKRAVALLLFTVALLVSNTAPAEAPRAAAAVAAPAAMVSFFTSEGCPEGWTALDLARGRLLVGTDDVEAIGRVVGTPLAAEEDRAHGHGITAATFELPYKSVSAADGSNNAGAAAGVRPLAGEATAATSGLPFVQLTTCVSP